VLRRLALLLAPLLLAAPAPAQIIMKDLPPAAQGLEVQNHTGRRIPLDLSFVDSTGAPVRLADLFNRPLGGGEATPTTLAEGRGRPVVVMMMYFRCPLLCPKTLEELTTTLNGVDFTAGTDFDVVCISFDPTDTPQAAARYKADALMAYDRVTTEQVRAGWSFLTGPAESSRALADALGFRYRYLPDSGEYAHRSAVFILTPDGVISRYLPGLQSQMENRSRDMRLALIDASRGRLGTWIDWLMHSCYHYDPNSGSYVASAMRVMRLGAGGCAVVLGVTLAVLIVHDRRRRSRRPAPADEVVIVPSPARDGRPQAAGSDPRRAGLAVGGRLAPGHAR
jgi:protein SCO1/2